MTETEKKVMVRLCAKILTETDLYDTDMEMRNLIDWVCVSEKIKENNNVIRGLMGEYKKLEPECREGVKESLERMKQVCEERDEAYERHNKLKEKEKKLRLLNRINYYSL